MSNKSVGKSEGLTERQKNIARLRAKLNKPNPDSIKVFTKYKIITYIFNIVFPPYSLYRIWKKGSPFSVNEKIAQTSVCIIYMIALASAFISGGV